MARKPRPLVAMEPRGSIDRDARVRFVPVPDARKLLVIRDTLEVEFPTEGFRGALVWLQPPADATDQDVKKLVDNLIFACAGAVRILPRSVGDALLPADAGEAAEVSHVSEVRPVVGEMVVELNMDESLLVEVDEYIDALLASEGL